jgi:hypothetical protein
MNLRKAAEQALWALEDIFGKEKKDVGAINALRQALAQPEPEPVGYVTNSGTAAYLHRGVYLEDDTPLYTAPPKPEYATEVVAVSEKGIRTVKQTTIPKRKWVGLTTAEVIQCQAAYYYDTYANIEAKLKEKNGG